jgi:transposase
MTKMAKRTGQARRVRRTYSDEFKTGAVSLVLQDGKSVSEVARDLDLTPSALRAWVDQARVDAGAGAGRPGALSSEERDELARLRRENRVLREERDILKKAAAFFAKERT